MTRKNLMKIIITCLIVTFSFYGHGQDNIKKLTLDAVIYIAKNQSPDALIAKHRFRSSYWQFRTYKAGYKPLIEFDATLPSLSRSIDVITQPDGTEVFIRRQISRSSVNLSISQNIPFTGGQIFMNTNLQRIDNFDDSTFSYLTTPLNIGIRQPIFEFNSFKWDRKIEPLRYEEAKRKYLEDMEQVSITATNYFFDLLLAQINLNIQLVNQANNDTLYQIAKGRYDIGTIAENELLQMELNLLNSNTNVEEAKLDLEIKSFNLKSFLRIKDTLGIELIPPVKLYTISVNIQDALSEARDNRSEVLSFSRRLLEAQSDVSRAKLEGRFSANLYAVYGLTQSGDFIDEAYTAPLNQEQITLGIQVPIVDWGLSKGKIKMAESNQELIKTSVEQDQIDFDQEVFLKVMQFNMLRNQLSIAAKSDTVAQKRYDVTKQRYLIGTINIIELNLAQTDKDNNRKAYISILNTFWRNYFELRKLTLHDYIENKKITLDLNQLM
jgi:outer membrane protein TolC